MMFKKLEEEIFSLEEELVTIRGDMEQPENYSNHENLLALKDQEKQVQDSLAEAYERWENW